MGKCQICTRGLKCIKKLSHEETKYHEDTFAQADDFQGDIFVIVKFLI